MEFLQWLSASGIVMVIAQLI